MNYLLDNDITTDRHPYVLELQSYLRNIQRDRTGATTVPQDGFFGTDTEDGVRQFQQESGLSPTGQVDRGTWDAIFAAHQEVEAQNRPPLLIRGLRQVLLQPGDQGDAVVFLNVMLGTPHPVYTTDTEEAVRRIQTAAQLPVTGNTDKDTWDAVVRLYNQGDFL